jgi:hypothetical protein
MCACICICTYVHDTPSYAHDQAFCFRLKSQNANNRNLVIVRDLVFLFNRSNRLMFNLSYFRKFI